ncbi:MAG: hypothetical protein ACM3ON_05625 [Chloroflexota bacterium]
MKRIGAQFHLTRHEALVGMETCSGTPAEYDNAYMPALRAEFEKSFAMSIEEFLPVERLMPLEGSSGDSLLFGTAVAVKERRLLHADLALFMSTCPEGYLAIGFRTQEKECPSFYYVRKDSRSMVYFRVPWIGSARLVTNQGSCVGNLLRRFKEFEEGFSLKLASLIAIEAMGEVLYEVVTVEGRRYRLDRPLGEADHRLIFEYPVISLPDDIEAVRKLQRKLGEYRQRVEVARKKYAADNGSLFFDTISKISILEVLLLEGEASTCSVARETATKYPGIDSRTFRNACAVIEDYCRDGGRGVWGGTGLR